MLSYGQTINMFYWIDDWGLLFHMVHPNILPGNFGHPAYRYAVSPFEFLYPFFGLNAESYFFVGFIQFYILTIVVFLFVRSLTKSTWMGLCTGLMFSAGYIGSYAMYRLSNSYQIIEATAFIIFTVWAMHQYLSGKKVKYYLFALIFFTATLELFFLRAQALFLIILAISIFLGNFNFSKKSILSFIRLHAPFLAIYYFFYFLDSRVTPGGSNSSRDAMQRALETIWNQSHFELLNNFLVSVTNAVIPQTLTANIHLYLAKHVPPLETQPAIMLLIPGLTVTLAIVLHYLKTRKNLIFSLLGLFVLGVSTVFIVWSSEIRNSVWNPSRLELFTAALGSAFLVFLSWIYFTFKGKEPPARLIPVGIVWVFVTVLGYYIYLPTGNLDSTSRYLIPGFVGTVLLYSSLFHLLPKLVVPNSKDKIVMGGLMLLTIWGLTSQVRREQAQLIKTVSEPSKMGFATIQNELGGKKVLGKSTFYYETVDDPVLTGNLLGGMPYIATAIAADFEDSATIADSYEHLYFLLDSGRGKLENTYTFFASHNVFINTTDQLRNLLTHKTSPVVLKNWQTEDGVTISNSFVKSTTLIPLQKGMMGINPQAELTGINYPSLTPVEVVIKMITQPLLATSLNYPYLDYSSKNPTALELNTFKDKKIAPLQHFPGSEIVETLANQKEKQTFRGRSRVSATTEGKTTEAVNLTDGNLNTNWSAYDASWNYNERPQEITIDLGIISPNLKKLFWVNHYTPATPTKYTISHSGDGINWTEDVKVENGPRIEGGQTISEELQNIKARYLRFSIYNTYGGTGYPPAIDEIWVSTTDSQIDSETQAKILSCVYCFVETAEEANKIKNLLNGISKAKVWWTSDAREAYHADYSKEFEISLDSSEHTYTIYIPAVGTKLEKLKIDNLPIPLNLKISQITVRSLTLTELREKELIKSFGRE